MALPLNYTDPTSGNQYYSASRDPAAQNRLQQYRDVLAFASNYVANNPYQRGNPQQESAFLNAISGTIPNLNVSEEQLISRLRGAGSELDFANDPTKYRDAVRSRPTAEAMRLGRTAAADQARQAGMGLHAWSQLPQSVREQLVPGALDTMKTLPNYVNYGQSPITPGLTPDQQARTNINSQNQFTGQVGGGGVLDGGLVGGGVAPPIGGQTTGNIPTTDQGPFSTNNLLGHIFSPLYRDPSYDFRFNEGQRALEGAQNARGLYNSGATQRALADYGQNMASTEFQNAFGRRQSTVNQALGITGVGEALRQGEFGRGVTLENLAEQLRQGQYGRQLGLAQLGMNAAGMMLGGANPTIPGQPSTGQSPSFNPVQSQANFNINPWAQLMQGAAGSIGESGNLLGQGQAASSLAWQNALQNIGNIFGSSNIFGGGGTTSNNAWSIRR